MTRTKTQDEPTKPVKVRNVRDMSFIRIDVNKNLSVCAFQKSAPLKLSTRCVLWIVKPNVKCEIT